MATRLPGFNPSSSGASTRNLGPVLELMTALPSSRTSSTSPTTRGGDLRRSTSDLRRLTSLWNFIFLFSASRFS